VPTPAAADVPLALARAHVLVKQGLAGEGLPAVMDAVVATAGIYGTAPTCYLSCAARVRDFRLAALDKELYGRRRLVRLRCMRGMAYAEPLEALPALLACTGEAPDKTLRRVAGLGDEVQPVSLEGTPAWVLASELAALRHADPAAARGVRLLPVWDVYYMGYAASRAGRARQVAADDYVRVYDSSGNGTSAVTVDGVAAGVWQLDADAGTATVAAFPDAVDDRWNEVEAQVARLARAIGVDLETRRAAAPGPLSAGPRNAFLSPITLGKPAAAE
jgi:hypothetical protein